jgi:hypothetical protein
LIGKCLLNISSGGMLQINQNLTKKLLAAALLYGKCLANMLFSDLPTSLKELS